MNDPRSDSPNQSTGKQTIDQGIDEDMEALRRVTVRDLPTFEQTARVMRTRAARASREGFMPRSLRTLVARPWLATAIGIAAVALILLAIPFTYSQTTGYEVRVSVGPPAPNLTALQPLIDRIQSALRVDRVTVSTDRGVTLSARLPLGSRPRIEKGLAALAPTIASLGPTARTEIRPIVERVSGTVYAMANARIVNLHVDREGKSTTEIEADLRAQLAAAGLPGAAVSVTQEGDQMRMQMNWEAPPGDSLDAPVEVNITMDGSNRESQKVAKIVGGQNMSDAEIEAEIERQLLEQGTRNPQVEVRDGKVVSVRRDP
jgi:hypothetical protein